MVFKAYIPNCISTIRLLMAPIVLFCPSDWLFLLLITAALTDFLDGFLARHWSVTSTFGALVDPIADKITGLAFAYIFWVGGCLSLLQLVLFFSRDIALVLFTSAVALLGYWRRLHVRAFWCGKAATCIQCLILSFLCLGWTPPFVLFVLLGVVSLLALFELPVNLQAMN